MKIVENPINKFYNTVERRAVVFHVDLGTYAGTVNTLKHHKSASYNLYIRRYADEVVVFVPLDKGSWHAGVGRDANQKAESALGGNVRERKADGTMTEGLDPNRVSVSICYEGRGVDARGNPTWDWSKVVDGEKPTKRQVELAAEALKHFNIDKLPRIAHNDITSYKPKCVLDMVERVDALLKENEQTPICSLSNFTINELFAELLQRIAVMKQK